MSKIHLTIIDGNGFSPISATVSYIFMEGERDTEGGSSVSRLALLCHGISLPRRRTHRLVFSASWKHWKCNCPRLKWGCLKIGGLASMAILLGKIVFNQPLDFGDMVRQNQQEKLPRPDGFREAGDGYVYLELSQNRATPSHPFRTMGFSMK